MTTQVAPSRAPQTAAGGRGGRWIEDWDPEDEDFWERRGRRTATRNLALSMFAEHIGFSVWVLWTVVVVNLANVGIKLSVSELFLLTFLPNLVGSILRLPYTFAVPVLGGRAWTTISAALLFIPTVLLTVVVPSGWLASQAHATQLWVLLACAATAGVGGGNFASSMANISFFFPEKRKGWALGLNAAGGNLGVAVCQLVVPLVVIIGVPTALVKKPVHPVHLVAAGAVWLPLIVMATIAAWLFMDSLSQARTDTSSYRGALRTPDTWIVSLLYIGTFGSFIGFSFAMPLVIKYTFPSFLAGHPFIATYLGGLGFVGAAVGSLARPLGGWLSDRVGGSIVTFGVFLAMGAFTVAGIAGVEQRSFATFFAAYIGVFLMSGVGNGSTYKMIPTIFATRGRAEAASLGLDPEAARVEFKRRAAAVLGITGAIGALGGALIQLVLRQSSLTVSAAMLHARTPAAKAAVASAHATWSVPALVVFTGAYVVLASVTYVAYLRSPSPARSVPALAAELPA